MLLHHKFFTLKRMLTSARMCAAAETYVTNAYRDGAIQLTRVPDVAHRLLELEQDGVAPQILLHDDEELRAQVALQQKLVHGKNLIL